MNNGSGALLHLEGRYLGVTCQHVLAAYRKKKAENGMEFFYIGDAPVDPDTALVDESVRLDLVTFDLTGAVGSSSTLTAANFYDPRAWPPAEVNEGDIIALLGFPGVWREQPGRSHLEFSYLSQGAAVIESVGDEHFCARLALDESSYLIRHNDTLGCAGGLSGAPVFVWRNSVILTVELVGFVYEYEPTFDLLYIRRARCIDADGTLLK